MKEYEYRDNLGNPRDYYDIVNDATKLCEEIEEKDKEIERLNNIINELENYMKEERINNGQIDEWTIMEIQMKLQELKEGK